MKVYIVGDTTNGDNTMREAVHRVFADLESARAYRRLKYHPVPTGWKGDENTEYDLENRHYDAEIVCRKVE